MCLQTKRWGEGVVHHQCSSPGIQINDRVCVLGLGYQRKQRTQRRDSAASSEGLWVLFQHYSLMAKFSMRF